MESRRPQKTDSGSYREFWRSLNAKLADTNQAMHRLSVRGEHLLEEWATAGAPVTLAEKVKREELEFWMSQVEAEVEKLKKIQKEIYAKIEMS